MKVYPRRFLTGTIFIFLLSSAPIAGMTVTAYQAEEAARLIAALLISGRVVVDQSQSLINSPDQGDKGFTPEVFERQVIDEFRIRTGVDLTKPSLIHLPGNVTELLSMLLQASSDVVEEAQPVINQAGVGYKNFIPATFGSRVSERFSAKTGVGLKQTTLQPRNPKNAPDPYEAAVLRRLLTQPSQSVTISEMPKGDNTLRLLIPIYYETECLQCHGQPAGQIDISGYSKEGAQEGDLAGAISVSMPLEHP
ncbi:MAG: DUF3365 domain-containing protein [Nitrospirales bacterium]